MGRRPSKLETPDMVRVNPDCVPETAPCGCCAACMKRAAVQIANVGLVVRPMEEPSETDREDVKTALDVLGLLSVNKVATSTIAGPDGEFRQISTLPRPYDDAAFTK